MPFGGQRFDIDGFRLYNKTDQSQKMDCGTAGPSGGAAPTSVICQSNFNPAVDLEMDSGDSITLVLEANITDNQVDSANESSLQVSISDFADRSRAGSIVWTDGEATFEWIEYGETTIHSTAYTSN